MTRVDVWFLALASGAGVMNAFTAGVAYATGQWWGFAASLLLTAVLGVAKGLRLRLIRSRCPVPRRPPVDRMSIAIDVDVSEAEAALAALATSVENMRARTDRLRVEMEHVQSLAGRL